MRCRPGVSAPPRDHNPQPSCDQLLLDAPSEQEFCARNRPPVVPATWTVMSYPWVAVKLRLRATVWLGRRPSEERESGVADGGCCRDLPAAADGEIYSGGAGGGRVDLNRGGIECVDSIRYDEGLGDPAAGHRLGSSGIATTHGPTTMRSCTRLALVAPLAETRKYSLIVSLRIMARLDDAGSRVIAHDGCGASQVNG